MMVLLVTTLYSYPVIVRSERDFTSLHACLVVLKPLI